MSVEPRRRKRGVVYGVRVDRGSGKREWELVGRDKRMAESRNRDMKREVKEGTYLPKSERKRYRVGEYCWMWAETRNNAWAYEERSIIRCYIALPPDHAPDAKEPRAWLADMFLDEAKPRHFDKLVDQLRATPKRKGKPGTLSDRTIKNVIGLLSLVFDKAVRFELIQANPVQLEPRKLKRVSSEEQDHYTVAEAVVLMNHHSIPWGMRVLNALCLLTGMRQGESAARRWRDLEAMGGPLECVLIHDQWAGRPLKTERPRRAPIHPELARILGEWAADGFELYTGRKPEPEDYIVPNVSSRATKPHHTRGSFYNLFVSSARAAGITPRTQHACRHTFLSMIANAGGNEVIYERITHNSKGAGIIARYTHFEWKTLCEQMLLVDLHVRGDLPQITDSGDNSSGTPKRELSSIYLSNAKQLPTAPGSSPGGATNICRRNTENSKRRGDFRGDLGSGAESESLAEFERDLRADNAVRKRRLLSLREVDPEAAGPGLELVSALEASIGQKADEAAVAHRLAKAGRRLGFTIEQVATLGAGADSEHKIGPRR